MAPSPATSEPSSPSMPTASGSCPMSSFLKVPSLLSSLAVPSCAPLNPWRLFALLVSLLHPPLRHKACKGWVLGLHSLFPELQEPPGLKHFSHHISAADFQIGYLQLQPSARLANLYFQLPRRHCFLDTSCVPRAQCMEDEVGLSYLMCSPILSQWKAAQTNRHLWLCCSLTKRTTPILLLSPQCLHTSPFVLSNPVDLVAPSLSSTAIRFSLFIHLLQSFLPRIHFSRLSLR